MKGRLTFGSLFTGIGGIDLGLERVGFEVRWQVEIDTFRRAVLEKHWPNVPKYGDIRELRGDELEKVDLVCGGPPCQPFSVAGKRKGKDDDRYLWPEMFRIIKAVKPRWLLFENVANIVNMAIDTVLFDLEAEGYETGTLIIPACAVGAPHRRDRVWIVAYSAGADGQKRNNIGGSGETQSRQDVAYAAGKRLEGEVNQARQVTGCSKGEIESRLGGDSPRISPALDGGVKAGISEEAGAEKVLSALRQEIGTQEVQRQTGGFWCISPEQCGLEPDDIMRLLSYPVALAKWEKTIEETIGLQNLQRACKEIGHVWETLSTFQEIWKSLSYQDKAWIAFRLSGRTLWPAPCGCEQYDWEPPRVTVRKITYRKQMLQAIGDAVVPQVVEALGWVIRKADTFIKKGG